MQCKHTTESDKLRVLLNSMTTLLRAQLPLDGETSGNLWWVTSPLIRWLTIRKYLFIEHAFLFLDTDEQPKATRCGGMTRREGMLEHGQMKGRRQSLRKINWKQNSLNITSGKRTANYKYVARYKVQTAALPKLQAFFGKLYRFNWEIITLVNKI